MSFEKRFIQLSCDRFEDDAYRVLSKKKEYRDTVNDASLLLNRIVELLGPDHRELVMAYEAASTKIQSFDLHHAYTVGLSDGISLKNTLDSVAS